MSQKILNTQVKDFLCDVRENSTTTLLEEGSKEKNELLKIAEARGLKIKGSRDLAIFKTTWAFVDKKNDNDAILPKKALLKILPGIISKPVNINHDRSMCIGHYIDYRYKDKTKEIVAYGVVYKSYYPKEWKAAQNLFRKGELSSSFEIWSNKEKEKINPDGSHELAEMEISGGALIFEDSENQPAFKNAKVLSLAKENVDKMELVYAAKHKPDQIITSATETIVEKTDVPTSETPAKVEEPTPIQPTVLKIKCSNCSEEFESSIYDTNIKCTKCFAIVNQKGEMIFPPQIRDFSLLCQSCGVDNWLILSNKEDNSKIRCLNCAKEYDITFKKESAEKNAILDKITFLYSGTANCIQCGKSIVFEGSSKQKSREFTCPKCGLAFTYNIAKSNRKRIIASIKEMEVKPKEELNKSKKEGGKTMELDKKEVKKVEKAEEKKEDKVEVKKEDVKIVDEKVETTTEPAKKPSVEETAPKAEEKVEVKPAKETPKAEVKKDVKPEVKVEEKKEDTILADIEYEKTFDKTKEDVNELTISKVVEFAKLNDKITDLETAKDWTCECLKCGKKITTSEHCNEVKCASCGGEMRRADRPGIGKPNVTKAEKLSYKERKSLSDKQYAVVVTIKNKKTGRVRKIRKYPLNNKANIRYALAQLKEEKTLTTLKKLGADVKSIRRKIIAQAKNIVKTSIIKKRKEAKVNAENKITTLTKELTEAKKQVELYKTEAKTLITRREELGDYANELTDADLLNEDKFVRAKLEKEKSLEKASAVKEDDIVGSSKKDSGYYAKMRKEITAQAYKKN